MKLIYPLSSLIEQHLLLPAHHKKSIFACLQVTSQSTKAPLYSGMSLVYKQNLIFRGAGLETFFERLKRKMCGLKIGPLEIHD
jgi:hypothetical protein